ncbi:hypothetical protein GCM10023168_15510 [Fodinibacter luteus]|uniref:DUF4870 domain-containing protein n=1 Tax=Fodinibacter luteus TaxID=552064 RepID=A0ABP8KBZ8_9MICO
MSDTTPRPDETPSDPTAPPPPPADLESADAAAAPDAPEAAAPPPPPPPAEPVPYPVPPVTTFRDPVAGEFYGQQQYAQQQYGQQPPPPPPPPAGAPAPGYEVATNPMKPSDERTTGMAAHGVTLAATVLSSGFLGFVCALVMYLVFRDRGPFVRHHAANALNIQIIAGIVMLVSLPLMLVLVGFLTFGAAVVWAIVMHIIGAVKANNGDWWNPPLTPQFVK